ncbi:MAG: LysE family transporter [Chloroflexi bacterium]|nr:LysE family transporter [Chloroflexota bacterium]
MLPSNSFTAIFFFAFSMAIGAVLSPGPVTTALISQSPRLGWITGPLVSLGHALTELVMAGMIVFGLAPFLSQPTLQTTIALLGGVLLLWMGGGFILRGIKGKYSLPTEEEKQTTQPMSRTQVLSMGVLTTISNPFWYAWWITVAAVYLLDAKTLGMLPVIAFYLGHVSVDFLWNSLLSTIVSGGGKLFSNRVYNILMAICGSYLLYLGVQFLMVGIQGIQS